MIDTSTSAAGTIGLSCSASPCSSAYWQLSPGAAADPNDPTSAAAAQRAFLTSWRLTPGEYDYDVAVRRNGSVVVSDSTSVKSYSAGGRLRSSWPVDADVAFTIDPEGNLHFSDFFEGIKVYSPSGTEIRSYGRPDLGYGGVRALVSDAAGFVYAVAPDDSIRTFSPEGVQVASWDGDGRLSDAVDIALGRDGNLYVLERLNERVQVFTRQGALVRSIGTGRLVMPSRLAAAPDGSLLVLDLPNAAGRWGTRIQVFTARGRFVGRTGDGRLSPMFGLALDRGNRLYVAGSSAASRHLMAKYSAPQRPSSIAVRRRTLDADKRRTRARIPASCSGGTSRCSGRVLVVRDGRRLARGGYDLAAGARGQVAVRLTRLGRARLRQAPQVKVTLRFRAAAGKSGQQMVRLTR